LTLQINLVLTMVVTVQEHDFSGDYNNFFEIQWYIHRQKMYLILYIKQKQV